MNAHRLVLTMRFAEDDESSRDLDTLTTRVKFVEFREPTAWTLNT